MLIIKELARLKSDKVLIDKLKEQMALLLEHLLAVVYELEDNENLF